MVVTMETGATEIGGGGIVPISFTPNATYIDSNTVNAEQSGQAVRLQGNIVTKTIIDATNIFITGLPKPKISKTVRAALYRSDSETNVRKLTIDTNGNLLLASGQSGMSVSTWVLDFSYWLD